jgi:hypothetical protein
MQISAVEPEAMIQPLKDKKSFASSYKPSVLANAVRLIVAQAVDASSEAGVVAGMLEQAGAQGKSVQLQIGKSVLHRALTNFPASDTQLESRHSLS